MSPQISTENVKYEVNGRIGWVTLDRPHAMNALTVSLLTDLGEVFRDISNREDVLVAVLTGSGGRAFSAGGDLKEMATLQAAQVAAGGPRTAGGKARADQSKGFGRGFEDLNQCPKPVIAAIDGYCLAGGFELAIYCDIRMATQKSVFGLPEARRSLLAGPGLINLPRLIPRAEAMRILLTGAQMSAERAYQIGLVQELAVDRDELMAKVEEVANHILQSAPLAIQDIKRIGKEGLDLSVQNALVMRALLASRLAQTDDALEGPRAFAEKREPVWRMR